MVGLHCWVTLTEHIVNNFFDFSDSARDPTYNYDAVMKARQRQKNLNKQFQKELKSEVHVCFFL